MSSAIDLMRAVALYRGPFRFEHGYIYDAAGKMVADQAGDNALTRIRGWGHIQAHENPEQLQDAVGEVIAIALTEYWKMIQKP